MIREIENRVASDPSTVTGDPSPERLSILLWIHPIQFLDIPSVLPPNLHDLLQMLCIHVLITQLC